MPGVGYEITYPWINEITWAVWRVLRPQCYKPTRNHGAGIRTQGTSRITRILAWLTKALPNRHGLWIIMLAASVQMLDFYRKTHDDFVKQTNHGAVLSVCAG